MTEPLFWLGLSILLVAVSLAAVLVALLPAVQELARAARSVEKLADTLSRELPPTLEAIRLTGLEISDLTDDVSEGVKSAGQVVQQVDRGISGAKTQAKKVQDTTRGVFAGVKAAWKTFNRTPGSVSPSRRGERLSPSQRTTLDWSNPSMASYSASDSSRELPYTRSDDAKKRSDTYSPEDSG